MTENKRFKISLIDNREYKLNDYVKHEIEIGKSEKIMYIMKDKLNALHEENINLKQALWEAEEEYLHEAYNDNPIRLDDKIMDLKEEWDREYWND